MVQQGKTVLKMTLVNSAKRAHRNLYSTHCKGERGTFGAYARLSQCIPLIHAPDTFRLGHPVPRNEKYF